MGKLPTKYFFVIALQRSGSTLLSYVLDSHPKIHVEHEDSVRPYTSRKDRDIYSLQWKIDNGLEAYLQSFLTDPSRMYLVTSRYFMKKQVQLLADVLQHKAKFIILTRKYMWRTFYRANGQARFIPFKQIRQFANCRDFIKNGDLDYIEVSYEEITSAPKATFASICEFIGVEFEPQMLEYHQFEHSQLATRGNAKTRQFKGIVDKSKDESISIKMLYQFAIVRSYSQLIKIKQGIKRYIPDILLKLISLK